MIHEVDEVLHALLTEEVLAGTDVQVAFDAPTKDWEARRNAPTVNLFLYDIREDMAHRREGRIEEYDSAGVVVAEHQPPRYFTLSYLVTAWTARPQDEHRLLSLLLTGLVTHDVLPPRRLVGGLAELGLTVPVTVAVPPKRDRGLADIWSALGGSLKPSLDLVVTTPIAASTGFTVQPVTDGLRLRTGARTGPTEERAGAPGRDGAAARDRAAGREIVGAETRRLRYPDPAEPEPAPPVGVRRARGTAADRQRRQGTGGPIRDGQR
ncbi:DUF4255 domain-containing protein [Micromonospora yangpuensis]|uniref:Pvc16 N-terminal domain-containing protein n=1 Tax=Micromonospora yangpuensis TaxID=683228 RepID=A0A1C6TWN4_9ACTN|nr:DUF4255 domain-containing protein [Micromonospora yangpuensis]GGM01422.1 hypothetical protein GCM10012279_18740 [Micromonospora yangpuensis]SCL46184.1 Protein of unknown function [Micromonospora yangpuensis]